jgi:acyl carrier protein
MKPHSAKFSNTRIGNSTLNVLNKEESSITNEESQMNTSYQLLELLLERFHEHQNGVLKAHELFLQNDKTAKNIIQDIASAEITILSKLNGNSQSSNTEQILSLLEKRAEIVNSQQNGSSEAHREFIRSQSEFSQQYAALIGEMVNHNGKHNPIHMEKENVLEKDSRAVKITRVEDDSSSESTNIQNEVSSSQAPQPISRGYDTDQLSQSFLQIVSDKTGYPTDMLELSMDMEADLGIDSIKRVEILGAMQEEYPQLPTIQAEDLVLLRTLKQIIAAFNTGSQDSRRESPEQEELFSQPESVAVMEGPINSTAGLDLQTAFLEIVSEKTGYPADMLEIGMDMEADLGIDSIKRVEILGAMQEQFPKLPTIEAEELSMLRTLEQIIQKFSGNSATTSTDGSKPQAPSESQVSQPQVSEIERHTVKLKMLPKPDFLKFDIPDDSLILITDDETEKSSMLADLYIQKNIKVGMIHFSSEEVGKVEHSNNGISHYYISHPDEEAIQFCMNNILEKNEKISAFIHINPASNGKTKSLLDISQKNADILKSVFLIARHLKKPLSAAGENGRSVFMTVTQMDGQLGLNGSNSNDPLPGGFPGLAKSLRLEWKNVFCRALDIHPDIDPKTVVKMIDDEMHDVDLHLTEIGYTSDGRYTLSLN